MPIQPVLVQEGRPDWCHGHNRKMTLVAVGLCKDFFVLQGSAAELVVRREGIYWNVSWCVLHSASEESKGRRMFTREDLEQAFGASDNVHDWDKGVLIKYGGTTARQGQFIRYMDWLNIPCPGTGHDGDPNVSIQLDEKMKDAVMNLLHSW